MKIETTPVREIMNSNFQKVHPDTPIDEIYRLFSKEGCTDLVVIDDLDHFTGIIHELELLFSVSPGVGVRSRRKSSSVTHIIRSTATCAKELMTKVHITIPDNASVADAIIAMEKNRHPDLIVIDKNGIATGIVQVNNIINFLLKNQII